MIQNSRELIIPCNPEAECHSFLGIIARFPGIYMVPRNDMLICDDSQEYCDDSQELDQFLGIVAV